MLLVDEAPIVLYLGVIGLMRVTIVDNGSQMCAECDDVAWFKGIVASTRCQQQFNGGSATVFDLKKGGLDD